MSLEARVEMMESRQDELEQAFRENNRVLKGVMDTVALILNEHRDTRKELFEFRQEHMAFKQEIRERFDKQEEKSSQLELLIRQNIRQN
ncbi:hypothetical protein [Endozoicomonas numazuensis]|nr:hypothetical protein [Endozoicomonas numazuensis]